MLASSGKVHRDQGPLFSPMTSWDVTKKVISKVETEGEGILGSGGHPSPQEHDGKILTPDLDRYNGQLSNDTIPRSVGRKMT